jgi:hypothetical protein
MGSLTSFNKFTWVNQTIPTIDSYKQKARDLDREEVKREVAVQVMPLTEL